MPAVMMAPIGMVATRGATMTKDALPIRGHHQVAAWCSDNTGVDGGIICRIIVIGIIIRVVVVIDAADEHPAKAMPVSKPVSGKSGSPCDDAGSGAERAAANGGAAETATTADATAAVTASATAAATMPAADFNREPIGGSLVCSRTARIDWRQCFCALAGDSR